jgi:carbon monoxide dehydrogenase subunit G
VVHVERTFVVSTPVTTVLEYLKDFSHAETWDPGTQRCTRTDSGDIAVGSTWHNVSLFRGKQTELDYELVRMDADRLTFVGKNKSATSTDDLSFTATGSGTTVSYRAIIDFHGLAKLAGPLLQRAFNGIADETAGQMTRVLNALSAG